MQEEKRRKDNGEWVRVRVEASSYTYGVRGWEGRGERRDIFIAAAAERGDKLGLQSDGREENTKASECSRAARALLCYYGLRS